MSATIQLMTADELLARPDDGFRYELVNGELRKMAPSGHEHGRITSRFSWRLAQHVEANDLGATYAAETGFLISTDPDTVRAPDVAFVARDRLDQARQARGFWPGAPDLAVEVVSLGDTFSEVEEKATAWLEAGTSMVLVLEPRKRTVTVYRSMSDIVILDADSVLDLSDVVSGFSVAIKELFD
jgi:Uma2 family endonuclease